MNKKKDEHVMLKSNLKPSVEPSILSINDTSTALRNFVLQLSYLCSCYRVCCEISPIFKNLQQNCHTFAHIFKIPRFIMYRTGSGMTSSVMSILSQISISKNGKINIYSFVLCKYMDMFFLTGQKKIIKNPKTTKTLTTFVKFEI